MVGQLAGEPVGRVAELAFEYAPQPPFGTGPTGAGRPATLAKTTEIVKQIMPVQELEGVRARRSTMGSSRAGPALASDAVTRRWSWFR